MTRFYAVMRAIVILVFKIIFRIKVEGVENIPEKGGLIICCNHISFTDPIFLGIFCKRQIFFMSKAELFKNKFAAWFFGKLGAFAVNRGTGDAGAVKNAEDIINEGKIMGIFPEGTRSADGTPKKAKAGIAMIAAHTKADILPASVYREGKIKFFCKTTVRFGELIPFSDLGFDDEEGAKKSNLRFASELIMKKIVELWEKKHNGTFTR